MNWTSFLFIGAAKATLILAAAFLAALGLRRNSSSARYLLWTSALGAALVLPFVTLSFGSWNAPLNIGTVSIPYAEPAPQYGAPVQAGQHGFLPVPDRQAVSWLILVWMGGAGAVLFRIAAGHLRVRAMLGRAERVRDEEWLKLAADAGADVGVRHPVDLRRSGETDIPLSYGWLRAVVLLPRASEEWTPERRHVVLLHELVHARRLDGLWSAVVQLASAAYWFHPLAWLAVSRFRREQERSCDDAVVRCGTRPSSYADHLVGLARSMAVWPAALGMATTGDLEQRVRAVLDPSCNRRALSRRAGLVAVVAAAVCMVPLAILRAQSDGPGSSLAGSVYDASGAAVPHAIVLVKNGSGGDQEMTRCGAAGEYSFKRLAAGQYDVEVKAPGFAAFRQAGLRLATGTAAHLDFKLDLGQVAETVDVVGRKPAVMVTETPKRIRVGGNVQATRLVSRVNPVYPANLQAAGVEGTVLLRAVISTTGDLLGLSLVSTSVAPELAKAATDAVSQWRYQPTLLNGVPVEVVTTIAVSFRLE